MLKRIQIQNYAIIDNLNIDFPEGLNIITGETGAGKSILLGALSLIMGKRADSKVLFDPDRKCFVEAIFDIQVYDLKTLFDSEQLDYDDELIIRREIAPGGKSRAFVNDTPVTLDLLQTITQNLVDIHQQFDMTEILRSSFQMEVIDALAGNQELLKTYFIDYTKYVQTVKKLQELKEKNKSAQQETEFLNFQMNEFIDLNPIAGEQEEKELLLNRLSASEDIKRIHGSIFSILDENDISLSNQLRELLSMTDPIQHIDPEYQTLYERMNFCYEEIRDIAREASRIADNTEHDAEQIQSTTDRLNQIYRMLRKHSARDLDELMQIRDSIQLQLDSFSDLSESITQLEQITTQQKLNLQKQSETLTFKRQSVVDKFESDVHQLLVQLSMEHAFIKVQILQNNDFTKTGRDIINFLFAPNKGSAFLPLKDVASGGEISRLMLCIKSLVANAITLPTLIFDEIDTGVSGEVAQKMGVLLTKLADKHQVIAISHSPQIASKADTQLYVYKSDLEHRTVTAMRKLNPEERIHEIAKMLSGDPPTGAAIANAKELLQNR